MTELARYELTIGAPPEVVYELLTERAGLLEWLAVEAEIEPRPGGRVAWTHANGQRVAGRILEIDPPHRLSFTYGWEGNAAVGPGQTVVEIELTEPARDHTLLRLVHRDLPESERDAHLSGWAYFLGRLSELAGARHDAPRP